MSAGDLPAPPTWRHRLPRLAIVALVLLAAWWLWPELRRGLRGTFLNDLWPLVGAVAALLVLWAGEKLWDLVEARLAAKEGDEA